MQKPKSVGALYCFLPAIREKTLQSSRSARNCRCLGSCGKAAQVYWGECLQHCQECVCVCVLSSPAEGSVCGHSPPL